MAELVGAATTDFGIGVTGRSNRSTGVLGQSLSGTGVHGEMVGVNASGTGVVGSTDLGIGVNGRSNSSTGVLGQSRGSRGWAVHGEMLGGGFDSIGVNGTAGSGSGVQGQSVSGIGVRAHSGGSWGIRATVGNQNAAAVSAYSPDGIAGWFTGDVNVTGDLTLFNGNKTFKIDHPLEPQNKYLLHNAVEAPERKNVYDGVAQLEEDGTAWVDLPDWFEALNGDFRYQLTAVGGAAPNLHIAEEIYENRFKIAGGEAEIKVCWQVTGTRKDPWAAANPFEVEQAKPREERGRYLEPSLYDAPEKQRVREPGTREEGPPQSPPYSLPQSVEAPQASEMPPSFGFGGLEELRQQIDELRGQVEELRQ